MRRELGLTQARMAEELGVSPSYVNLIERNQRPVSAPLLLRIAQTFDIELRALASDDDERLFTDLREVFSDPVFQNLGVTREDAHELATGHPVVAEAVAVLYRAYRDAADKAREGEATAPSAGQGAQTIAFPIEEVRDVIQARANYFPDLDERAEALYGDVGLGEGDPFFALRKYIEKKHGVTVRILPADVMMSSLRRHDRHNRQLLLSETLDASSRNFQLALQIGLMEMGDALDRAVDETGLQHEESRRLGRITFANYFAAALIMPYAKFQSAAEDLNYDIEALGRRFSASFEQVCHRLTSMQRPGALGVPFFLIRVDVAGNISKRFSGGGFPFSRFGGACPRWNIHDAFRVPGRVLTQVIALPEGEVYFSIARTVRGWPAGFGAPNQERSVAIGCDIAHAKKLVYARGLDLEEPAATATEIGVTCQLCERPDCPQRAHPPLNRRLIIDESRRMAAPFAFSFD